MDAITEKIRNQLSHGGASLLPPHFACASSEWTSAKKPPG
jgi:hypothetical protein